MSHLLKSSQLILLFLFVATTGCLFFACPPLVAQPGRSDHPERLTVTEGLSQGMVFDIAQTSDGFLWFATKDGLNRYDGYNFRIFRHDPFDPFSLCGNQVVCLFEDSRGLLWAGTERNGVSVFHSPGGRFFQFSFATQPGSTSPAARAILQDPAGAVWVATQDGWLHKFSLPIDFPGNGKAPAAAIPSRFVEKIKLPASPGKTTNPGCLILTHSDEILIGTSAGMLRLDWKANRLETIFLPSPPLEILSFFEDRQGRLWAFSYGKVLLRQEANWEITSVPHFYMKVISQEESNHFWFIADEELYRVLPGELLSGKTATMPTAFENPHVLQTGFVDEGGLIWLATPGFGLLKFNPKHEKFTRLLEGQSLYKMFLDPGGRLWAKYYQGDFFPVDFSKNQLGRSALFGEKFSDVKDLAKDERGVLWAWVIDRQKLPKLARLDFRSFAAGSASGDPEIFDAPCGISVETHGILLPGKDRQIWVGLPAGLLARWDDDAKKFTCFRDEVLAKKIGEASQPTCLLPDANGDLWLGTENGLVKFEIGNWKLEIGKLEGTAQFPNFQFPISIFQTDPANRNSLSFNHISWLLDDPRQPERFLWVATKGGGLNRLDKQAGTFQHFNQKHGLPDPVVYGILAEYPPPRGGRGGEQPRGSRGGERLWMSTNKGLSQFDPETEVFKNFTQADGLQSDEFNTASFLKLPDPDGSGSSGRLLFGGINGLNIFKPEELTFNEHLPKVQIVGVKINNQPYLIPPTSYLHLAHFQNLISIEFAALDFANPAKNRYRYRLEGADPDWVEAGAMRFANYTRLPPGEYLFKVQGSNNDGIWSEHPATLRFRIAPPWWRSGWAYLLYAALLGGVVFGYVRFRFYRLRLQHDLELEHREALRLSELDTFKTKLYTNITHEFRTPLTVIMGMADSLKMEIGKLEIGKLEIEKLLKPRFPNFQFPNFQFLISLITRNSGNLLNLVNQMLDLSKLDAGALALQNRRGDVVRFLKYHAESFQSLAASKNVALLVSSELEHLEMHFDEDKLGKVVSNLLSNAVKFTPEGGRVKLEIGILGYWDIQAQPPNIPISQYPNISISISDTGIGIPSEKLPHIFDRFFQASETAAEGTGIGLALVHELVKLMGGVISVESPDPKSGGKGTTFTVRLPISREAPESALESDRVTPSHPVTAQVAATAPAPSGEVALPSEIPNPKSETEKPLLLLVEDNPDVASYIQILLQNDYEVAHARNGREGLGRALETVPDLVISDVMMPEMNGYDLCHALKTDERTSHIPIILLTAKATQEDKLAGLRVGADAYLMKPFHKEELFVRLEKLLELRRRLQERFGSWQLAVGSRQLAVQSPADFSSVQPLDLEDAFIRKLRSAVEAKLDDADFGVPQLSRAAGMSQVQLYRKLKALTDTTPVQFVRTLRLRRAKEMLSEGKMNVSEVAYSTGFTDPGYFARAFREEFGVAPHEARK